MKEFKFFQKEKSDRSYILPYQRSEEIIPHEQYEGWNAHHNNLPPGQCPYDIGTREREYWMTGWSNRENYEPQPIEDELYMELEDTDTGEHFGIPVTMHNEITTLATGLYIQERTVSGRCGYYPYEYWIDNVYRLVTTEVNLVIDVTISVPTNTIRDTFHKVRLVIPYE